MGYVRKASPVAEFSQIKETVRNLGDVCKVSGDQSKHLFFHTATDGETEEDREAPPSSAPSPEQQSENVFQEEVCVPAGLRWWRLLLLMLLSAPPPDQHRLQERVCALPGAAAAAGATLPTCGWLHLWTNQVRSSAPHIWPLLSCSSEKTEWVEQRRWLPAEGGRCPDLRGVCEIRVSPPLWLWRMQEGQARWLLVLRTKSFVLLKRICSPPQRCPPPPTVLTP